MEAEGTPCVPVRPPEMPTIHASAADVSTDHQAQTVAAQRQASCELRERLLWAAIVCRSAEKLQNGAGPGSCGWKLGSE